MFSGLLFLPFPSLCYCKDSDSLSDLQGSEAGCPLSLSDSGCFYKTSPHERLDKCPCPGFLEDIWDLKVHED